MIEEYCRIFYNIGLELKCGLNAVNCLCPDKNTYEYLCYQYYLLRKAASGEVYRFRFDSDTGKIIIEHMFVKEEFCSDCSWSTGKPVKIVLDDVHGEINKNPKFFTSLMRPEIGLSALALTQHNVRFRCKNTLFTHLVDAFRTEQFMDHFWNLSYAVMRKFQDEKDCEELLIQLGRCIDDINKIYKDRRQIGSQILEYCRWIYSGFEKEKMYIPMYSDFYTQQCDFIDSKMNATSIEQFIFCSIDSDGTTSEYGQETVDAFINICSVSKNYIVKYQEQKHVIAPEVYENVISSLNVLSREETDMYSTECLKKIDFHSEKAWQANACLILEYLRKVRRGNCIVMYN